MGTRVALIKHERPRILALDFSEREATRIRDLGFNIRVGKTGCDRSGEYNIPWALQDVEILIASVSPGCFSDANIRSRHESSVEDGPHFRALLAEIWVKQGWTILFIKQDTPPRDLEAIGIRNVGAVSIKGLLVSHTDYVEHAQYWAKEGPVSALHLPRFKGEAVVVDAEQPEGKILERHLHGARMSIFSVDRQITYEAAYSRSQSLIQDESSDKSWLALKFEYGQRGKILLLPDFGKNNIDVAIALLQEVISDVSPSLFDDPQHKWLKEYLPHPVEATKNEKEKFLAAAVEKYDSFQKAEDDLLEEFRWLIGLLTSAGDEFRDSVAVALRFIGFKVDIVDLTIAPGAAMKEDLDIVDVETGFFALGETKSTKRGASETFLTDVQNHQGRYSRENRVPVPNAILIINHSTEFDPSIRSGRFYQNPNVEQRCIQQGILALDSVALFQMCQFILSGLVSKASVRSLIQKNQGVIRTFVMNPTGESE
jgi:hypothetical protein